MNPHQEEKLLHWGMVLSPALFKPPDDLRRDRQILLAISRESFITPKGDRKTYSLSTLKRKLKAYRKKGMKGFEHAIRSDEGCIRKDREEIIKRAIELKTEAPARSHSSINLILRSEGLEPIPASTLLRHLNQNGATLRKLGYEQNIVRKRWTRPHTHDLWVGDFSQGPTILDKEGRPSKTWVSAFIDVHSRFLIVGIYAKTCDVDALVGSLLPAFEQHGIPRAIYLDNAKVYRGRVLSRACLDLGIELIHRKVRDPQGGGIIERFFLSAQKQFESEFCTKGKTPLTLERLNELFSIYVNEVYHRTRHSEIEQTPRALYPQGLLNPVVPLRRDVAQASFYQQWERKVHTDFCDVTLHKRYYACDLKWRGDKVLLRASLGDIPDELEVYHLNGRKKLGKATLHDRSKRRIPDPRPIPEDQTDYAQVLERIRDLNAKTSPPKMTGSFSGSAKKPLSWTLENFVTRVCAQADIDPTEIQDHELRTMKLVYQKHSNWTVAMVSKVWKSCEPACLQQLLLELSK